MDLIVQLIKNQMVAFLIESSSDVIRVEGTLNILQNNAFSQSVNFIEGFYS